MDDGITASAFRAAEGIEDWRVVGDGAHAHFRTGSISAGTRFVAAIGDLPGIDDHGPAIDLRADAVTVRLDHGRRRLVRDEFPRCGAGTTDLGRRP